MCSAALLPVPPSSSTRIHYCPLGLIELCEARHGFAKSTEEAASIYPVVEPIDEILATFCEATSGFANLLSPKRELHIVPLLVGGLHRTAQATVTWFGKDAVCLLVCTLTMEAKLYKVDLVNILK